MVPATSARVSPAIPGGPGSREKVPHCPMETGRAKATRGPHRSAPLGGPHQGTTISDDGGRRIPQRTGGFRLQPARPHAIDGRETEPEEPGGNAARPHAMD